MISFVATPASGNPSSTQTANPPPLFKAPFHAKTAAPSPLRSNLPSITHSPPPILAFSARMPAITPFALSTTHPPPHLRPHPNRNKPVSIASWPNSTTLGLFALRPYHLPHLFPEHLSPVLSGLVRVDGVGHSGIVRVPVITTRLNMSCLSAPLFHPLAVASLEAVPLTPMSLARLMAQSPLAISNAPPTVSYAPSPPDRTLLDW